MITIEKSTLIFNGIKSTRLDSLKNELLESALRYASIRADWYLMTDEDKRNFEDLRIRTHDVFIDACNILSREMIKAGEDASWRVKLGNDRKDIGDFAGYVHCLLGLSSR